MLNMSEAEDSIKFKLEVEKAEAVTAVSAEAVTAVSPSSNASDNENGTQPPNSGSGCNCLNKKWMVGVGTVLVTAVTVGLGVTFGTSKSTPPIPKCNGEHLVDEVMKEGNNGNAAPEGIRRLIANTDAEYYLSIGCFRTQDSPNKRPLMAITQEGKADECHSSCRTSYFGIVDSTCYCHSDSPQDRLSIGSCQFTENPCVEVDQKMEMYFKINADENCGQDTTSKVRNFMVEENDVPFGFDIVTNQFRPSPFELFKSKCGTNIYEVQTEISEGSQELSTSVYGIKEFAKQERSHLSQSISTTASAGYDGPFVKAMMKVSASSDKKQTRMFRSSGAAFAGGKVFNSVGVKRLAEVKIEDFDNKRGFVTLNEAFVEAIKTYRNSGYDRSVAREQIFNKYGMFILTRGIFGGYLQLRSTMTESSISSRFESSEESRQCFEESVSAEASLFGFSGGGSGSGGECKEQAKKAMLSSQNDYAEKSSEQVVVGGKIDQGNFVVEPEFSTLLTSRDKYPAGDKGIEFRPLSDFLSPEAMSPLNVMKYSIVEAEFLEIQTHLKNHLREELLELEGMVDECGDCEVPYLVEVETEPGQTNKYTCTCYDPESQGPCSNWNTDPNPPIDDFVYLKWNGLCISAISNGELYSRGCRGGHSQRWKFESNGLLRSHWNQQQCVGISGTGKLILQTCDDTNSQQMWGYDQDNGYLFQLKDRCKCATIVPSEREHFEMSKLQLGKCSFEGEGSGSKPLCYDGIPLSNPDSEKNYCCQSTCLVDATGSPQCDGKGCSSLVAGISNCCASQLGTKVCTAPGDTGCYTTEDVGFKSFEGAMLQQFVYKQLLP